jgi:eukaryotic-like serine/threonine-protein kinase
MSVRVGQPSPDFALECISSGESQPRHVTLSDFSGRWLIAIFYPRDFTFVCPTELTAFSARLADFQQRDCDLIGISVDSIEMHQEWLLTPPSEGGLGPLQFPLASDAEGKIARAHGVWDAEKAVSTRGLFVIDPDGILQYVVVHNLSVGRNPDEVLRVLDALQSGGLCPASWTSADGTIDPESALRPGKILGHYRIQKTLGAGTFGTVFAAWDLRLERMVALKVLKRKVIESRDAVLAEARAAARLSHPNVCTIYAVDEEDGLPIIAMEYLEGDPLSQVIAHGLVPNRGLQFAAQIASGLANAHQNDVVHGDLKPANVIVTKGDTAKIVDFGLAKSQQSSPVTAIDSAKEQAITPTSVPDLIEDDVDATVITNSGSVPSTSERISSDAGTLRGTPAYMSPEHALGLPVTSASDVFAFGLMLFEMLTGHQAVSERTSVEWLFQLRTDDLSHELAARVDEPHRELLAAILAREPVRRPSLSEVAQQLTR